MTRTMPVNRLPRYWLSVHQDYGYVTIVENFKSKAEHFELVSGRHREPLPLSERGSNQKVFCLIADKLT